LPYGAKLIAITTSPFFTLRNVLILALWCLFSWHFVRNSIRQDQTGDPGLTRSSLKASAVFILLFALTLTIASFDLLMSLEPLKNVLSNWLVGMKFTDVVADIFITCVTQHIQVGLICPQNGSVRGHPVHSDHSILNKID